MYFQYITGLSDFGIPAAIEGAEQRKLKGREAAMNEKNRTDTIYELLGLQVHTPAETVKKTFREFARKNHPDFFPGDRVREEKFKRVCAAYQTWKLIHTTLEHIRRMRNASRYDRSPHEDFKPWTFSCTA